LPQEEIKPFLMSEPPLCSLHGNKWTVRSLHDYWLLWVSLHSVCGNETEHQYATRHAH